MGLAQAPTVLPAAARTAVVRGLLRQGLLEERPPLFEHRALGWRQDETGEWLVLQVTDAGLRAIGVESDPARRMVMTAEEEAHEPDLQQSALEAEQAAARARGAVLGGDRG